MNSELYDKTYKIPPDVLKGVQASLVSNPHGEGVKRAKNILRSGKLTYQAMKRLKNFFDGSTDAVQYALAGGDLMKHFVDSTLAMERKGVKKSKEVRQDMHVDVNLGTKAYAAAPDLNEAKKELDKNAVAVIVNEDKVEEVAEFADRLWLINNGEILIDDEPQEFFKQKGPATI